MWDWDPDWSREDIRHRIRLATEDGELIVTRHRRKDGNLFDVEISANVAVWAGQKLVLCVCRDITERTQTEGALAESEWRFRQMADIIGEVFWFAPPDISSILYVSPAFARVWGRPCAELYANPMLWIEVVVLEDRPRVEEALAFVAQGAVYDAEFRITRPDGSVRWIHDRGYPLRDAEGQVILTSGVATDITERKQAEEERQRLEAQFIQAQKMESVGRLAGGVAHDFNNMLGVILGYTQLAMDCLEPDDPVQESLVEVQKAAQRSADLTRRLAGLRPQAVGQS